MREIRTEQPPEGASDARPENYKRDEHDQCKEAIHKQLAAYERLVKAMDGTSNPLNEVELRPTP